MACIRTQLDTGCDQSLAGLNRVFRWPTVAAQTRGVLLEATGSARRVRG